MDQQANGKKRYSKRKQIINKTNMSFKCKYQELTGSSSIFIVTLQITESNQDYLNQFHSCRNIFIITANIRSLSKLLTDMLVHESVFISICSLAISFYISYQHNLISKKRTNLRTFSIILIFLTSAVVFETPYYSLISTAFDYVCVILLRNLLFFFEKYASRQTHLDFWLSSDLCALMLTAYLLKDQQLSIILINQSIIQIYIQMNQEQPSHSHFLSQQLTDTVIMIRPYKFSSNQMTLANNYFQNKNQQSQISNINTKAQEEFDELASSLKKKGIRVIVVQDPGEFNTPDSVFPNNWISFHKNEGFILYPMFALNRRLQRKIDVFSAIQKSGLITKLLRDYSKCQEQEAYLEGTGSMVLDRQFRIAFAAISARTDQSLFLRFCQENNYQPCPFRAYQTVQNRRELIYHTNVVMWVGEAICGVCLSAIDDPSERQEVQKKLLKTQRQILHLDQRQVSQFAGNTIMLRRRAQLGPYSQGVTNSSQRQKLIVMSQRAYDSLNAQQKQKLKSHGEVVPIQLETIQKFGGGSARCMIAQFY